MKTDKSRMETVQIFVQTKNVKKSMKRLLFIVLVLSSMTTLIAQNVELRNYQQNQILTPFRLPFPEEVTERVDLDDDGDPDVLKATLPDGTKILWIDDDDDMEDGDLEGDTDSDCVMLDLNNDGDYGGEKDLIVDWADENLDGKADLQFIVDNGFKNNKGKWESHFIIFFDDDQDGVFSYVNWDHFKFEGWDHSGQANFFADYNGMSKMLKVHISSWNISNLEYNWENPFLYFDEDGDGLTEMAIRVIDEPINIESKGDALQAWEYSKKASLIQMTWDLDNDSAPSNEQDFDFSLKFMGKGFDYSDQVHPFDNIGGIADSDYLFDDARWRHLEYLVYPDHETTKTLTHQEKDWEQCWMVFDEDDDCHRWERVEFYDPKDPYLVGSKNGGLDHNPQADVAGDRGEWDLDFSGKGKIYISPLDCRIHLYGAEEGFWRIDQNATYYQGWQGWRGPNLQPEDFARTEPAVFGIVHYEDTDGNGFMDQVSFDMDGDKDYEEVVSLIDLMIDDQVALYDYGTMDYDDMTALYQKMAEEMWQNALHAIQVVESLGLNTAWYSVLKSPKTLREKYNNGFWLSYYLYQDLKEYDEKTNKGMMLSDIQTAYFSSNWKMMLKE